MKGEGYMGVIHGAGDGEWERLLPDGNQACFHCGKPLEKPDAIVLEGYNGLVNGINQHALRMEAVYFHPACAAKLITVLLADVREVRND